MQFSFHKGTWQLIAKQESFYSDYEAQIARCKERIEEGILPELFEDKLKRLVALLEIQR